MPPHQRSRPSSHDSSSSSSPRLPLSSRPPRSKHSFPSFNTPVRRSRHNSENFPPDNNSLPSPSPDPPKSSSSKPHNHTKHHASPSLPPRPPSLPRPSPVSTPVTQNRAPPHSFEAHGNAKRKLNLDSHDLTEIETSRPSSQDHDSGVKVVVRLRPMNQREESEEATHIVQRISDASLNMADQHFTFDRVAAADASQRAIFEIIGLPIVEHCLQGFNSSIFAYGQTGSGKTYTMWGSTQDLATDRPCSEELGLTPRVFQQLFQRIREEEKKNADKQLRYQCRCSFFEIYNEQITDLLDPVRKNLQVREDTKTGVYVENLTEEYVSSVDDVFRLMLRGLGNRKIGSTSMNVDSSRSHSLFTCVIESRCKSMADGVSSVKTSRMNLVDLAGSERQKLTGAAGERLKEAGNINRSLSQLGNLINILAEVSQTGRPRHIPYRDSRLTFLLQESLGGNAKLAMICAISPASSCRSETLSTLRFAQRAKSIKNKAVVNEETENDVNFLREQIRQLKDELMRMKSSENQSLGNGGYSTGWNARRSYNLLRMSLIRPLTLPHTDEDTDEEMEIEEEGVECSDAGNPSTSEDESIKTDTNVQELLQNEQEDLKNSLSSEEGNIQNHFKSVPKDNETVVAQNEDAVFTEEEMHRNLGTSNVLEGYSCQTQQSMDTPEHKTSPAGENSNISFLTCNSEISIHHSVLTTDKEVVQVYANASLPSSVLECNYLEEANNDSVCTDSEISCNIGTPEYALKSPVLSISPQLASRILQDPPLSDSPRLQEEDEGSFGIDMLPVVEEDASPQSWPVNTIDTLEAAAQSPGKGETRKASSVRSPLQSSKDESMKTDVTLEYALKSPVLNISPHLASSTLPDSPLSDSPRLQEEDEGSFRLDMLPVVEEDASPQSWPSNITDALDAAKAAEQSPGKGETKEASSVRSSLQSSKDESMKTDVTLEFALKSPVLSISPHLASSTLQDSPLSDSPRLQEEDEGSFSIDMLPVVEEDASPQSWPLNTTGALEAAKAAEQSPGKGETRKASSIRSSLQSSKDESVKTDITLEYALKSPVLSISPHLASSTLQDPTLSDSPRLQEEDTESFRIDMLPVVEEDASPQAWPLNVTDTLMAAKAAERKAGKGETRKASSIRSSLKSSKKLSSPTDRLAASLHRGLQILENHQKGNSRARTSVVRFSFQNPEFDRLNSRNGVDKSVQTLPARLADDGLVAVPEECLESMTPVMELRNHLPQSVEAVLAGAMRRERAMEETLNRKDAEIEQLNRLVRQYKHERECNALLQQSREDKIARLENLMEGSMPTDAFLNEEWRALVNEHKTLQDKYDHHPEVTLANIRQQRLSDDLEHYRNFFDLGERDALLEEIRHLRDQLQFYVESGTSAKQRRLSLTPRAKMRSSVDVNLDGSDSLGLYNPCERSFLKDTLEENVACEKCDDMKTHCSEVENEWMSQFEEKRMEADEYKQLAEKRKQEVEGERRCAEEMKEALQIAMEGHARLLDQYAELQEKHIGLLAKHRKVRDAMAEAKRKAGKLGFLGTKWFEAHAAELVTLKLEQEHERQVAKEQIEGLQAQVRDTADAVQAAGELLVRLKEAEEAVLIAQDAAAHSEQDVDAMRREIEKLKRKHSTEIATFQQRLLEARFQRSTVCPMCVMAERVKFQFTEVDAEEAEAALEAEHLAAAAKEAEASLLCNDGSNTLQKLREELEEYEDSEGSYLHSMNHEAEADEGWYEEVSKCNF